MCFDDIFCLLFCKNHKLTSQKREIDLHIHFQRQFSSSFEVKCNGPKKMAKKIVK